jgi:succinate dehydrogenase/fumarate reductase flavoprotein subunit
MPSIIVVGAGMAGLVAAVQAQELGAQVTLVEKSAAPGGSLALSGGTLWCAKSYEDLRRLVPRGDPILGRILVEEYQAGVAWLQALGVTLSPLPAPPDRLVYLMEPHARQFVAYMTQRFIDQGGVLLTGSAGDSLVMDENGIVTALIVRNAASNQQRLHAGAVILTTGGFQANPELRARYFGQWADRLVLRSNPHSTGDGLLMALEQGAAASPAMSSFYGHLIPAPPAVVPTDDFIAYTHYHSEQAVLVNQKGERFTDESLGDETSCQAVARQPEALAFILYDDMVYRTFAVRPAGGGARASDTFYESQTLGAPTAVADTLDRLVTALEALGVYGPGVAATIQEFNTAVAAGRAAHLRVPRRAKANPLVTAPFYALGLTSAITFTLGGLQINQDAQVLDRSQRPIRGLYAAGADAGGIHNEQYAGGLCLGLVFGRRAAKHACVIA